MNKPTIFIKLRHDFHRDICINILGNVKGYPNNADKSSKSSIALANGIIEQIGCPLCTKPPSGQTAGAKFSELIESYLSKAFAHLNHLRPGKWLFSVSQERKGIAGYDQYKHLVEIGKLAKQNAELAAILGGDYLITPDIVVARLPVKDLEINKFKKLIDKRNDIAKYTPLRLDNDLGDNAILHASISCKWTIRSDRTQNTRTEALNLIRNRKGNTPHIMAVVAEPLPTRIASIAMGTGDIDCVYHIALSELIEVSRQEQLEDQHDMLMTLIKGRRLRDISDLVFDLAI
jgi:hypothetical protein